jgi:hypothetical protein
MVNSGMMRRYFEHVGFSKTDYNLINKMISSDNDKNLF